MNINKLMTSLFMVCFVGLFINNSPLHAQNCLPYSEIQQRNDTAVCNGQSLTLSTKRDDSYPGPKEGFTYIGEFGESHYYASNYDTTWSASQQACVNAGGHLATINASNENDYINNNILPNQSKWIGYTDQVNEGDFEWVTGIPTIYTNWDSGEPNDQNNEDYTELKANGFWNDDSNSNQLNFVLEVDNFKHNQQDTFPGAKSGFTYQGKHDGSYYYLSNGSTDWHAARRNCRNAGGELVTINDANENSFVQSLISNNIHIGFTDQNAEGNFVWTTGEPVNYTNWLSGEPNNAGGSEDHVEMDNSNGQWNDLNASTSRRYVLEISDFYPQVWSTGDTGTSIIATPSSRNQTITVSTAKNGCTETDSITVDAFQCNGRVTWTGNEDKDWSNLNNWINGDPSNDSVLIPGNLNRYPEITAPFIEIKSILIQPSASINIISGLDVEEEFENNGQMDIGNGTLLMNGAPSSIKGRTKVGVLNIESNIFTTLEDTIHVEEMVRIKGGATLNAANNSELRLLADQNGVAYLDDFIFGKGSFQGELTMEQVATTSGWHYLSSPMSNATIGEFHDDFHVSEGQSTNFYYYNEPAGGSGFLDGWTRATTRSFTMDTMQGFDVYFWNEGQGRASYPETFDITGNPTTGPTSIQLTSSGSHWNMVGNPYPSPIDWDQVTLPSNIYDGIYIWNPINGQFATYIPAAGGSGTNGADNLIAPMQSFFVWANPGTSPTLSFDNSIRVVDTTNYVGKRSEEPKNRIKLSVKDQEGNKDETIVYFNENATKGFDGNYDAYEFKSKKGNMPSLYSMIGQEKASINGMPEVHKDLSIPVKLESNKQTTYTINASFQNLEPGVEVYLEDKTTNKFYDLQNTEVEVDHKADETDRFALRFSKATTSNTQIAKSSSFKLFSVGEKVVMDFGSEFKGARKANVKIMTATGKQVVGQQKVTTQGRQSIDLGNRSEGLYIIEVRTATDVKTEKVLLH